MGSDLAQAKCNNPFFRAEIADFPDDLGIEPGQYLLYVSRLEPENNAHLVVAAYNSLPKELKRLPLIIVGDAPYADKYKGELRSIAGENIRFAGFRFGAQYEALQSGAFCYLQATEVGGTHPALVEAIGFANCVIANDTPEHREVIGNDAGLIYKKNNVEDLRRCLVQVLEDPEAVVHYRRAAYERARKEFDWEEITNSYEELFYSMVNR
jgi:glycosyltransferase involved in cell wall biosynthesis